MLTIPPESEAARPTDVEVEFLPLPVGADIEERGFYEELVRMAEGGNPVAKKALSPLAEPG